MTNRMTLAGAEVRADEYSLNGTGSNAHPTHVWETVTEARIVDGLILLVTGDIKGLLGEI